MTSTNTPEPDAVATARGAAELRGRTRIVPGLAAPLVVDETG